MKAYLNDPKIKEKYVARVKAHAEADEIIKGTYWQNGKGCAVGCTIEGSDHSKYEKELGIPEIIAHLEDSLFESLPNGTAKAFPLKFLEAVPVGADLSKVIPQLVIWQFEDEKYGLKHIKEVQYDKEVYALCERVVALYKRELKGKKPTQAEYQELYEELDRAWAGPWARAWAGAGAMAWAGAGAMAWAGAGTMAWAGPWAMAWAGVDEQARFEEAITATSEKLLSLLRESNQPK